jgi:hypothetical protein
MKYSENEGIILNKIATSSDPLSAYDLAESMRKDYSTIHKTCKKLIGDGILEVSTQINEKNVGRKVLKFTFYGFLVFVSQSELFISPTFSEPDIEQIENILVRWGYLHEAIGWVHHLLLKGSNKDLKIKGEYFSQLYFSCKQILWGIRWDNGEYYRLKSQSNYLGTVIVETKPKKMFDDEFYRVIFKNLFVQFAPFESISKGVPVLPIDIIDLIKNSERGYPLIKKHLKDETVKYELLKKIDRLLL